MLRDHGARRPDREARSTEARIGKLLEAPRKQGKAERKEADLLGGDGDLAGLLLCLLADEPHHLLDLLGDIGVVHLGGGGGSDAPSGLLCSLRRPPREVGDGNAGAEQRRGGNRESTGMVEAGGRGASLAAGAT